MKMMELKNSLRLYTGMSEEEIDKVLSTLSEIIIREVKEGNKVIITNFGTFSSKVRKERIGINPNTGEKMEIEEQRTPVFTPSEYFKDVIKERKKQENGKQNNKN